MYMYMYVYIYMSLGFKRLINVCARVRSVPCREPTRIKHAR